MTGHRLGKLERMLMRVPRSPRVWLDGIGLGYLFLDASHFKYHARAAANLVLAA